MARKRTASEQAGSLTRAGKSATVWENQSIVGQATTSPTRNAVV